MAESFTRNEKRTGPYTISANAVRYRYPWPACTPTTIYATQPKVKSVSDLWTVGFSIPHFHARVRKGELLPQTPFWQFRQQGSSSTVYDLLYKNSPTVGNRYWSTDGNFNYHTDWIVTYAQVEAKMQPLTNDYVQEAAAAIYANGHDTLTFIAELASIKSLFLKTGERLVKLNKLIPRSRRDIVGDWLSARYGWRTLKYDLESLYKSCMALNVERQRFSEKKGNTFSEEIHSEWTTESSPSYVDHYTTDKITRGLRGSVVADIVVPLFQFNPIQTGWELVPYSFVLDWFVGVGKAISAGSFLATQSKYSASMGHFCQIERSYSCKLREKTTYPSVVGTWEQTATCVSRIERRVPCGVPITPHIRVRLNAYKVIDLIALILQRT